MTDDGKAHIEEIDEACMEPLMMYYYPYTMVNAEGENELKQMLAASGMTLDDMPLEMWEQMGAQVRPVITSMRDSMGDEMIHSSAISCTMLCYDSIGYDYEEIQMDYLKRTGLGMILMTLLMVVSAILTGLVASRVAARVGCDLREGIFKKVISFFRCGNQQIFDSVADYAFHKRCSADSDGYGYAASYGIICAGACNRRYF